jgi:hypothetical protein
MTLADAAKLQQYCTHQFQEHLNKNVMHGNL